MKYTRIDIKSEADLPKDSNWYIGFSEVINDFVHFNPIISNCKDLSWYLIEDTEPSYPEEFVEFLQSECEGFNKGWRYYKTNDYENGFIDFKKTKELYNFWLNEIKDK